MAGVPEGIKETQTCSSGSELPSTAASSRFAGRVAIVTGGASGERMSIS